MSRPIINRILLGIFIVAMLAMGSVYLRQEQQIAALKKEEQQLLEKQAKIEYLINEYLVLIDNVNTQNFIIRMAREKFGWVFDNETIYVKNDPPFQNPTSTLPPVSSPTPGAAQ